MFRKIFLICVSVFMAHTVYAQSLETTVHNFCAELKEKDITSIHTRTMLLPYFVSENDLSNFIVYMNIKMENAGFKRFTVLNCATKDIKNNGIDAEGELEITGEGALFFLKEHVRILTVWINKDNRWYLESPSTINTDQ